MLRRILVHRVLRFRDGVCPGRPRRWRRRAGRRDGHSYGQLGPVNKLDRINDMLKLSKDQRKELKQTFDEAQKEAAPLHEQILKARMALGEALACGQRPG